MANKPYIISHFTDFGHTPERKKHNTFGALGYYRTYKPSKRMEEQGRVDVDVVGTDIIEYSDTFESNWQSIFTQYDLVWIMHFVHELNASAQAFFAERLGKKLVYDLDDNYLDLPESNPVYEKFQKAKRDRSILSATLSFADALTVSTEPLKERMQAHMKNVYGIDMPIFVIPNMNDVRDWNFKPAPKHKDRIVIGYSGSNSHQDDLVMVLPVINKLMTKYPNLWFELIGAIDKKKLDIYFKDFDKKNLERIAMLPATPTFWEYPEYLSKQKWDIGIAPLVDTAFTRSKSHIKWLEYSMYQIPVVASRVYPYFMELCGRKTITDGETGFLCNTQADWESKLEKLILDKRLRKSIGKQAYDHIKENWQYEGFDVDSVFKQILELPSKKAILP